VVTGEWLLKNEKFTVWLKNKTWTNLQIKSRELWLIRPQTLCKNPEHILNS